MCAAKSSRTEAGSGAAPTIGSAQRADVGVDRDLRQGAVDGGDGGHRRDPVVLDDRPEPGVQGRVAVAGRARPHHPGAAEHRGDAGDDQRVDVEQRQPAQHPLPGRQPAAHGDAAAAGELVGVGVRGDLRGAGGPAGVHERRQIVCRRRVRAGQVAGRLPGDHVVQVGHDRPAAVRGTAAGASPARAGGCRGRRPAAAPGRRSSPPARATSSSRCHSCGSSSGPAATRTRDPVRRISSAIRSARKRGVDRGGDPGGLRGQRGGVQHRGVDAGQRHRVPRRTPSAVSALAMRVTVPASSA